MTLLRPRRRTLPHAAGSAALLETGAGDPPLLLIHGFAADAFSWQYVLVPLAKRRRVIALDLPGHAVESRLAAADWSLPALMRWTVEAVEAASPGGAHLCGHSLGGRLALAVAEARPDLVRSVSVLAGAGIGTEFDLSLLDALLAADTVDAAAAAMAAIARGGDREALARAHAAKLADADTRRALEAIRAQVLVPARTVFPPIDWSRLDMPVRLIWGEEDRVIPCPDPTTLPRQVAMERLAETGHLPHIERPSAVVALLERTIDAATMPQRASA
jgi:pyruvate dehydrogenase E2 component (dihydrolipoamide acetyltransferase)